MFADFGHLLYELRACPESTLCTLGGGVKLQGEHIFLPAEAGAGSMLFQRMVFHEGVARP